MSILTVPAVWRLLARSRSISPASPPVVPPYENIIDHLQAWYRLDGDLTDALAGKSGAVVTGEPKWGVDRSNHSAGALVLEGNAGISLPGIVLKGTSFSIQFWTLNPQRWIIGQGEAVDAHGLHIGVGSAGMRFDYWGNDLIAPLGVSDAWTHWVLTHDLITGTKSTWRDADCVARKVAAPYLGSGDVTLGRHFTGGGFYSGSLDDVAFWRKALSPEEIRALFDGTFKPSRLPR